MIDRAAHRWPLAGGRPGLRALGASRTGSGSVQRHCLLRHCLLQGASTANGPIGSARYLQLRPGKSPVFKFVGSNPGIGMARAVLRSHHRRAEPSRAEPSRAEPSRAEPSRAEPSRAEPSRHSRGLGWGLGARPSLIRARRTLECRTPSGSVWVRVTTIAVRAAALAQSLSRLPTPTALLAKQKRLSSSAALASRVRASEAWYKDLATNVFVLGDGRSPSKA